MLAAQCATYHVYHSASYPMYDIPKLSFHTVQTWCNFPILNVCSLLSVQHTISIIIIPNVRYTITIIPHHWTLMAHASTQCMLATQYMIYNVQYTVTIFPHHLNLMAHASPQCMLATQCRIYNVQYTVTIFPFHINQNQLSTLLKVCSLLILWYAITAILHHTPYTTCNVRQTMYHNYNSTSYTHDGIVHNSMYARYTMHNLLWGGYS